MLASVTTASEEKEERPPEDFIFGGEAGAVFQNELFEDEEAQRNPTPGKLSSLLPPLSPLLPCLSSLLFSLGPLAAGLSRLS